MIRTYVRLVADPDAEDRADRRAMRTDNFHLRKLVRETQAAHFVLRRVQDGARLARAEIRVPPLDLADRPAASSEHEVPLRDRRLGQRRDAAVQPEQVIPPPRLKSGPVQPHVKVDRSCARTVTETDATSDFLVCEGVRTIEPRDDCEVLQSRERDGGIGDKAQQVIPAVCTHLLSERRREFMPSRSQQQAGLGELVKAFSVEDPPPLGGEARQLDATRDEHITDAKGHLLRPISQVVRLKRLGATKFRAHPDARLVEPAREFRGSIVPPLFDHCPRHAPLDTCEGVLLRMRRRCVRSPLGRWIIELPRIEHVARPPRLPTNFRGPMVCHATKFRAYRYGASMRGAWESSGRAALGRRVHFGTRSRDRLAASKAAAHRLPPLRVGAAGEVVFR